MNAIGREDLLDDPRFATPEARFEHSDEVNAVVSAWTRSRDKREVMELIGAAGVPAGAVFDNDDLANDPFLRERGMFVEIEHPVRGKFVMPGWPIKMSRSQVPVSPAPLLGQHSEEVLGEVLGYTDLLIERDKAANRKVIIDSLQAILETSMQQWRVAEDPRFLELAMRATDRLTKLLRLDQPEGAVSQGSDGPDVPALVSAVRRDLAALESRMGSDGGAAS